MRFFIASGLLLAIPNSSYGQNVQAIGELSVGYTTAGGELGSSDLPFHTQIAGGIRVGDISLELFGDWKTFAPERSDLHSESVVDLSLGTQLRWFVNKWAYVRVGAARHWLYGDGQVQRTCSLTGACDGGFYNESPDYSGVSSRAGVGVFTSHSLGRGSSSTMAISADLGIERMSFPFFGQQKSQHALMVSLGVFLTGGTDLQRRND